MKEERIEIQTSENTVTVIPLAAFASWGELLGLTDQGVLGAILAGEQPVPLTDDPDDYGWLAPYEALRDVVVTETLVTEALRQGVSTAPEAQGLPGHVFSMLGQHGPELVLDQTAAIQEDVQRSAAVRMQASPSRRDWTDTVAGLANKITEQRKQFRDTQKPPMGTPDEATGSN